MNITEFSRGGKTLCVEFKCARCGAIEVEHLKSALDRGGEVYHLSQLEPPRNWSEIYFHALLCSDCTTKAKEFMQAGKDE